jgi:hypothetical protein
MNTRAILAKWPESTNVQLEQVFSHPWMSYDEEKWLLELTWEAIAEIVSLIAIAKKQFPETLQAESIPDWVNIPTLVEQGLAANTLSITKKRRVRWFVWKVLDRWRNGEKISPTILERVTEKVWVKNEPSINIWLKIWDQMLPAPMMIFPWSTFESVRIGLETRLRYSTIFAKKK